MSVLQVAGIALLACVAILVVRELRASLALPLRMAVSICLLAMTVVLYAPVVERIQALFSATGVAIYAGPILRATGIALICEFTASMCRDLGENTVAGGVLLFGKIEILVLCLPLVDEVLDIAKELLQF